MLREPSDPRGSTRHMHIQRGKSGFFWVRMLPKVIFLGPKKYETMLMIFFDTKHRCIDISRFDGGNPDFYLHCLGIFYVHVQGASKKLFDV